MSETPKEQIDFVALAHVFAEKLAQIASIAVPIMSALAEVIPKIASEIRGDWKEYLAKLDALPAQSKIAMGVAADKGWFFGWSTALEDLMPLIERITSLPENEIDQCMVDYYRHNFQDFVDRLQVNNSSRSAAIAAAARAHIEFGADGFFLSTPVFIAQADGWLSEILGVESPLGMKRDVKGEPKVRSTTAGYLLKRRFESDQESLDLLHPVFTLHDSDFLKGSTARSQLSSSNGAFTALNRHQVMHGECSDYGTEVNSLKAFSFLVFVGLHLQSIYKDKNLLT
ncbi:MULTISPECIES: hypothetical protein [Pseudomonas]|uniref:hypothetical protein n=1 Tax=Pseudomonas TaxID=286 RepID=UPI00159FE40A|nr:MULTISPECIES: hypothetical protein [Pseudomonas]NWD56749.1 hypothetical protein [Pseudomonas veronii]